MFRHRNESAPASRPPCRAAVAWPLPSSGVFTCKPPCVLSPLLLAGLLSAQTLAPPLRSPLPSGFLLSGDLMLADVDHDGIPDVAALSSFLLGGSLVVMRGDGGNGFRLASATSLAVPRVVRLADLDGDQRVDAWVGGAAGTSAHLHGDGAGGFVATPAPALTESFCIADFDGDGHVDVMTRTASGFDVALGDGAGTFRQASTTAAGAGGTLLLAADLDGDGDQDVLAGSNQSALPMLVLRNDGTAHFAVGTQPPPGAVGARSMHLADVDGDGDPDLIYDRFFLGVAIHCNDGTGHFASAPSFSDAFAVDAGVGDLDGDGLPDLAVARTTGLTLCHGDGTGAFVATATQAVGSVAGVVVADTDLDGDPDVLAIGGADLLSFENLQPVPAGVSAYGTGTGTCRGRIGIRAAAPPTIGNRDFIVVCSNTPPLRDGLLLMGSRVTAGWDPLGIDLQLHLGVAVPVAAMASDAGGSARGRLPIPRLPLLAGLRIGLQSLWLADTGAGDTCSPAFADLASSRGLAVTLQR